MTDSMDSKELHVVLQRGLAELLKRCAAKGLNVQVTSTYRDFEMQDKLYAQGRTAAGNIVTNCKAGQSLHNWRLAFDFCKDAKGQEWSDADFFKQVGGIWEEMGGAWGGNSANFADIAHCEFANGLNYKDFQAGEFFNGDIKMKWETQ